MHKFRLEAINLYINLAQALSFVWILVPQQTYNFRTEVMYKYSTLKNPKKFLCVEIDESMLKTA